MKYNLNLNIDILKKHEQNRRNFNRTFNENLFAKSIVKNNNFKIQAKNQKNTAVLGNQMLYYGTLGRQTRGKQSIEEDDIRIFDQTILEKIKYIRQNQQRRIKGKVSSSFQKLLSRLSERIIWINWTKTKDPDVKNHRQSLRTTLKTFITPNVIHQSQNHFKTSFQNSFPKASQHLRFHLGSRIFFRIDFTIMLNHFDVI